MADRRLIVAITGAAGTIGKVLAERMDDAYDFRLLDRAPFCDRRSVVVDLGDLPALERAFDGADAVIHLGAAASVVAGWADVLAANIVGTYHVLEAARSAGVSRVVFASSNHVVGMYEHDLAPFVADRLVGEPLNHLAPLRPDSLYGVSKGFGELLGRFYSEVHGIRVVCLRLGTVLGSDDPRGPAPPGFDAWAAMPWDIRIRGTWLSHRDCAELFRCALEADVRFAIAYGVSDVPGRFWDLEHARSTLGFVARDRWPERTT
jgi:nucleoside-diphosphate-sugar epimerase